MSQVVPVSYMRQDFFSEKTLWVCNKQVLPNNC